MPKLRNHSRDEKEEMISQDEKLKAKFEFLNKIPSSKKEITEEVGLNTLDRARFFPQENKHYLNYKTKRPKITKIIDFAPKTPHAYLKSITNLSQGKSPTTSNFSSKVPTLLSLDTQLSPRKPESLTNLTPSNITILPANFHTCKNSSSSSVLVSSKVSPRYVPMSAHEKHRENASPSQEYLLISRLGNRKESLNSQMNNSIKPSKPEKENNVKGFGKRMVGRPLTSARKLSKDVPVLQGIENVLERRRTTEEVSLANCLIQKRLVSPVMSYRDPKGETEQNKRGVQGAIMELQKRRIV